MLEYLKQQWHHFEAEHLTPKMPEHLSIRAVIAPNYLAGECNGKVFGRIAWADIEQVVINIEGDFEPYPYWYIGHPTQGVRLPEDAENMGDVLLALAQHLPGFSGEVTRKEINVAMQASEGRYRVWAR